MTTRSLVVTEIWLTLGWGFLFPGAGSHNSQRGFDVTVEKSGQNSSGKRGTNVQQSRSNVHISPKDPLPQLPPNTKSLEPTNVMVW